MRGGRFCIVMLVFDAEKPAGCWCPLAVLLEDLHYIWWIQVLQSRW